MNYIKDKARISFFENGKFKSWKKLKNLTYSEILSFLENKNNTIKFYFEYINNIGNHCTEWHILDDYKAML